MPPSLLCVRMQEFVDSGRMWEKSRNYPLAIEAYLSVNRSHDSDPERLNEIWQHALRLAQEHEKHAKYVELADDVAHRYVLRHTHVHVVELGIVCACRRAGHSVCMSSSWA
jgi:hypothetical protein